MDKPDKKNIFPSAGLLRADLSSLESLPMSCPCKIGKYDVVREISRGAMGMVYLGHDPFANLPVALKVANHHSLQQSDQRKIYQRLFFNELHTASRLHHPYITHVYDAGIEDGSYYIAMEYVGGDGSLEKYRRPDNRLPTETIAEIIFQCAEGPGSALPGCHGPCRGPQHVLR